MLAKLVNYYIQELRNINVIFTRIVNASWLLAQSDLDHDFSWDDIKIIDTEQLYNKRLISEMLHRNMQNNDINLMKDTEYSTQQTPH